MNDSMLKTARGLSLVQAGLILGLTSLALSVLGGCGIGIYARIQAAQAIQKKGPGAVPDPLAPDDPMILGVAAGFGMFALLSISVTLAGMLTCRTVPAGLGNARSKATTAAALTALALPFSAGGSALALFPGKVPLPLVMSIGAASQTLQILATVVFLGFLTNFGGPSRQSPIRRFGKATRHLGIATLALILFGNLTMAAGAAAGAIPNAPGQAPPPGAGLNTGMMLMGAGGCLAFVGMVVGLVGIVFYMIMLTHAKREARRLAAGRSDADGADESQRWYDDRPDDLDDQTSERD